MMSTIAKTSSPTYFAYDRTTRKWYDAVTRGFDSGRPAEITGLALATAKLEHGSRLGYIRAATREKLSVEIAWGGSKQGKAIVLVSGASTAIKFDKLAIGWMKEAGAEPSEMRKRIREAALDFINDPKFSISFDPETGIELSFGFNR